MRKTIALTIGALVLAAGVGIIWFRREQIAFLLELLRLHRAAREFYDQYEHLTRDVAFHPEMEPRLDVYAPPTGDRHPVLIFLHGGSWRDYHKELFAPVAMRLLPSPMVVVIPDYSLFPSATYETMTQEVAAAISWTLENIQDHGGDPNRVVVVGHSAGAHLGALALADPGYLPAYGHSSKEVCGFVGLSGVYDVQAEADFWLAKGTQPRLIRAVMGGEGEFAAASPLSHVREGLSPTLLIHGDQDETVPVSISTAFHQALRAAGSPSELKIYPAAGHSDYLLAALTEEAAPVVTDLVAFVGACGPR